MQSDSNFDIRISNKSTMRGQASVRVCLQSRNAFQRWGMRGVVRQVIVAIKAVMGMVDISVEGLAWNEEA